MREEQQKGGGHEESKGKKVQQRAERERKTRKASGAERTFSAPPRCHQAHERNLLRAAPDMGEKRLAFGLFWFFPRRHIAPLSQHSVEAIMLV